MSVIRDVENDEEIAVTLEPDGRVKIDRGDPSGRMVIYLDAHIARTMAMVIIGMTEEKS